MEVKAVLSYCFLSIETELASYCSVTGPRSVFLSSSMDVVTSSLGLAVIFYLLPRSGYCRAPGIKLMHKKLSHFGYQGIMPFDALLRYQH